jgi:hypothetical protein
MRMAATNTGSFFFFVDQFCPHCGNSILVRQLTDQLPPEYDLGFNVCCPIILGGYKPTDTKIAAYHPRPQYMGGGASPVRILVTPERGASLPHQEIMQIEANTADSRDHYKNVGDPYVIPEHKGARPSAEVEGGQTYNGSCHCGAVTLHVNSKPIDDTYEGLIVECNCSVCERVCRKLPIQAARWNVMYR